MADGRRFSAGNDWMNGNKAADFLDDDVTFEQLSIIEVNGLTLIQWAE